MFNEDGMLFLQNILVKLDAPGANCGVLFVAHYDSVPEGPGAADPMLNTVSLLEALRSQAQNNALNNDLYFLFTDGEERGCLGAYRFAEAYPELYSRAIVLTVSCLSFFRPASLSSLPCVSKAASSASQDEKNPAQSYCQSYRPRV